MSDIQGGDRAGEAADSAAGADADLSEIHRFELLRHELFELERRVQRSTDGSQNDEVRS